MKKVDSARVLAISGVILAITYFYLNIFSPRLIPTFLRVGAIRKPVNVLIMGTDLTYSAETKKPIPELEGRADTIILVHIDPVNYQINALSIPRDTYVLIPRHGRQKINAANVYGSVPLLKETVSSFLQQDVDYYIEIKPTAISKLIDLMGGVTLYVEKDMRYADRAQKLDINLKKGWQKLSGKKAQDYIRFRYDIQGDIGRVERQQKFLKALTKTLTKPTNILKAPFAIRLLLEEIRTDLPLSQTIRLLNLARMASIKSVMASGEVSYIPRVGSVWRPNKPAIEETVRELF